MFHGKTAEYWDRLASANKLGPLSARSLVSVLIYCSYSARTTAEKSSRKHMHKMEEDVKDGTVRRTAIVTGTTLASLLRF